MCKKQSKKSKTIANQKATKAEKRKNMQKT